LAHREDNAIPIEIWIIRELKSPISPKQKNARPLIWQWRGEKGFARSRDKRKDESNYRPVERENSDKTRSVKPQRAGQRLGVLSMQPGADQKTADRVEEHYRETSIQTKLIFDR
jgi:hypothetical protein